MRCMNYTRSLSDQGRAPSRSGVTLVEILAVIGIIGVIASLITPAVQSAREQARRVACFNNLHQLGIAAQAYAANFGVFPYYMLEPEFDESGRSVRDHYVSLYTALLPHVDESVLYAAINFSVAVRDPFVFGGTSLVGTGAEANRTLMSTTLSLFLCPSDNAPIHAAWTGPINFRASLGTERWHYQTDGSIGLFRTIVRPASIRDGLSNTAMLSERVRGLGPVNGVEPRRLLLYGGLGAPYTADDSLAECARLSLAETTAYGLAGASWFIAGVNHTGYNHVSSPNSVIPDCLLPHSLPPPGIVTARSNHPGGVHVGFADGSVHWINNSIHREIWRALGTRAGGEFLSIDSL